MILMSLAGGSDAPAATPLMAQPKRPTGPFMVAAAVGLTSIVNCVSRFVLVCSKISTFWSHALGRISYECCAVAVKHGHTSQSKIIRACFRVHVGRAPS